MPCLVLLYFQNVLVPTYMDMDLWYVPLPGRQAGAGSTVLVGEEFDLPNRASQCLWFCFFFSIPFDVSIYFYFFHGYIFLYFGLWMCLSQTDDGSHFFTGSAVCLFRVVSCACQNGRGWLRTAGFTSLSFFTDYFLVPMYGSFLSRKATGFVCLVSFDSVGKWLLVNRYFVYFFMILTFYDIA